MELSKRLEMILENIEEKDCLLDVGTDHGYIPIEGIKRNLSKKAIAADINKDPLDKAKLNAIFEGVDEQIEVRLGNGLDVIEKDEVSTVVIAGMGGNLIRDILEKGKEKIENAEILLLPAQNPEVLRKYLYTNGYKIQKEDICLDEGIFYEFFKVRVSDEDKTELEDVYYEISPILIRSKNTLMKEFLESKKEKVMKILENIKDESESATKRKKELEEKIDIIDNMMKFC
ncbi:MAG: tRNA (adenine(22)-N(1))-methyltransferase [Clostridium sp.]|uniref:tRNA (adenine(22)-N(1))-methyltransferase n=1 Tax=Clostridium sp. TaxID=1506 RepID=UPI003F3888DF